MMICAPAGRSAVSIWKAPGDDSDWPAIDSVVMSPSAADVTDEIRKWLKLRAMTPA